MGLFLLVSCGDTSLEVHLSESADAIEADADDMVAGDIFSPLVSIRAVHAIRSDENGSFTEIDGVRHRVHFIEGTQGETGRTVILENMETGEPRTLDVPINPRFSVRVRNVRQSGCSGI